MDLHIEDKQTINDLVPLIPHLSGVEFKVYVYLLCYSHSTNQSIVKATGSNRKSIAKALDKLKSCGLIIEHSDGGFSYSGVWVKNSHLDALYNINNINTNIVPTNGKKIPTWAKVISERFLDAVVAQFGPPHHLQRIGREKLTETWGVSLVELESKFNFDRDTISDVVDYLINEDNFWIRKGAMRSPAKLSDKMKTGDKQLYIEYILDQMKFKNRKADDNLRNPYE